MIQYSLNLEALSPLTIRSDHAAGGAGSAAYISGTALAGSLATIYRLYYPNNDTQFEQLFLSGEVQYPDFYPAMFNTEAMQDAVDVPVYPLPKTAQSCKRFPGFSEAQGEKSEDEEDSNHGVRDSLLDWAAFKLAEDAHKNGQAIDISTMLKPLQAHKECPVEGCDKAMDHIAGFYRRDPFSGQMAKASDETRLQTHTGINRDTGTVQEGILYNRQVFVEHTRFWGMVKLPEQLAALFENFINEVGRTGLVRIGTGRTRGMGKVSLSVTLIQDKQDRFDKFQKRLRTFDDKLKTLVPLAVSANKNDIAHGPFYFALTQHSPAILRDPMLRYYGSIDPEVLWGLLNIPQDKFSPDNFSLIYQTASTRRVSGWNELWGLPRVNEYAIDTGSVFLFASHIIKEQEDELLRALFTLEEEGIGRRKAEGFGRVSVSDPFHWEVTL